MTSENRAVLLFSRSARAFLIIVGIFGLLFAAGAPVQAARSTAAPVPQPRWNSSSALRPGAIIGDSTFFAGHDDPKNGDTLMYHALDIEGHYLFTATGQGMQVINLDNPAQPDIRSYIFGWITGGSFPLWQFSDKDWYIKQIDAPAGNTDLVALTMEDQGFAIVKTQNKDLPFVTYQRKTEVSKLYAFTSGSTAYAYATDMSDSSVYLFNLTASSGMVRCHESPPEVNCPGVYQGPVLALGNGNSGLDGVGNFLVTGKTGRNNSGNMKVWNISTPGQPTPLVEIAGSSTAVAMWQQGSAYFAARLDAAGRQLSIYNVSCIATGSCTGAPLVWTGAVTNTHVLSHITASTDGGKSYLYVGGDDLGSCAAQREFIYDVSSPSAPEELTPKIDPAGYWGWYYMTCPTGFNLVGPRTGKVYGGYLFRAAMSILDSHQIVRSGPPVANFTWSPSEVYPNTPVQFSDASGGGPNSWSWTFAGGTPSAASTSSPQVSFSSTGPKAVTLTVGRDGVQSDVESKTVNVLDPAPQIAGAITVSPASPVVCQPVTLTPNGVTGQPTLNYSWEVRNTGGTLMPNGSGSGTPFVWNTNGSTDAGSYTGTVTVSNASGINATKSVTFSLGGLTALPLSGQFQPINDVFQAGTVKFHVTVPGATEWSWDFDDDANPATSNFTAFSSDPVTGPNPSHSYSTIGARVVRVRVKNCTTADPNGILSGPLPVAITQISPLIARFLTNHLSCSGGTDDHGAIDDSRVCIVDAGDSIGIADASTGAERWDYDWDGNGTWEDADNTSPRATHVYSTLGDFFPRLRVRRGTEENIFEFGGKVMVGAATQTPSGISIGGASSGQPSQALTFSASGTGSCSPSATGWSWTATGGGSITGGTTSQVSITWTSTGTKSVSATNSACGSASGSKSVTISTVTTPPPPPPPPPPTTLQADFTFSPTAPAAGQVVSLNGATSTGTPQGYVWDFGDGTPFGTGAQVTHTYALPGSYNVSLSVNKPGNCAPAPFCESTKTKTIVVGTGEAPLGAAFATSATCIQELGLNLCSAAADEAVTFTDQSSGGPTSWSWSFGDGGTATGRTATHTFANGGTFAVSLTVSRGATTSTVTKSFSITEPVQTTSSVVLPWIAQSRGALDQSSDLYIHNPGTAVMNVTIEFRKRGTPESNPPRVNRAIQPGATLFIRDALSELFNRENIAGFITVLVDGRVEPVITSFNTTVQADGSQFGQTVPGVSMSRAGNQAVGAATGSSVQHLIGLNDNEERLAYFGFSNPSESAAIYRLKFFNKLGQAIGETGDLTVPRFGQQQFQVQRIRDEFHVSDADDYRVQVETQGSVRIFPYGANLRIASDDPSFVGSGSAASSKVYLIGALSSPGLNRSIWQSDIVLSNTSNQVVLTDLSFIRAGAASTPTPEVKLTLQPGETQRLVNAIATKWGIRDAVGVLTLDSDSPNSVFPVVQGESYENSNPARRFGQSMAALSDADAAGPGQSHFMVGLRQDIKSRTTYWLFNPGSTGGDYDVIYRALDGTVLGRMDGVKVGAGKVKQISPSQHPIPAAGVQGGFTVQVVVRSGKVLSAAQVINNATNDPAYIEGRAR